MTREEAIKIINCYDIGFCDLSGEKIPADKLVDAFYMAIEALEGVCFDEWCTDCKEYDTEKKCCPRFNRVIRGAMNREPSEDEPQGDLISRADAIEALGEEPPVWCDEDAEIAERNQWKADVEAIESVPPADRPIGEWIDCKEPPSTDRNVFIAYGTDDMKSVCIGHYRHDMKMWYEDKNFFAKPLYDGMYWCEIPQFPTRLKGADDD